MKIFKSILYVIIIFILLYLNATLLGSGIRLNRGFKDKSEGITIYICTNGLHSSILLPVRNSIFNWLNFFEFENFSDKKNNSSFIAFGWGEKDFYMKTQSYQKSPILTGLKALFCSGKSVILAEYVKTSSIGFSQMKCIKISENQYLHLVEFIIKSFDTTHSGKLIEYSSKKNTNYRFFASKYSYSLFYTCNNWTADAMKKAEICAPLWSPFAQGI